MSDDEPVFVRGSSVKSRPESPPGNERSRTVQPESQDAGQTPQSGSSSAGPSGDRTDGSVASTSATGRTGPAKYDDAENQRRREQVRNAMRHAWSGYRQYAWGRDELKPSSKSGVDWLGLGATIVDSLDTLYIMDLQDEFKEARDWIASNLNFDRGIEVSLFETTIRVLGGLCSAYDLSGDRMFLDKADDLAGRLAWAFNTSSGIPYASINLQHHVGRSPGWTGGASMLSEVGTLQLEFKHVSHHTGNMYYAQLVQRVMDRLDRETKSVRGLYPIYVHPATGSFTTQQTTFGALGDSFYEYLIKQWWFTGKKEPQFKRMYEEVVDAVLKHLIKRSTPSGLTYIAEWSGSSTVDKMDHLACFVGGTLAMGAQDTHRPSPKEEMDAAVGIGETCFQFYKRQPTGLSPELVHFRGGADFASGANHNIQRPEAVETFFYLWRFTHDKKWRDYGAFVMDAFDRNARMDAGYAGLRDVTVMPPVRDDQQQSFFLAETLKYLYLLFCEDDVIPLDQFVFNTEAHPLRRIA